MGFSSFGFETTCNSVTAYAVIDDLVHKVIPHIPDGELHNVLRRNGSEAMAAIHRASIGNENQAFHVVVNVDGYQVNKVVEKEKLVARRSHHGKRPVSG